MVAVDLFLSSLRLSAARRILIKWLFFFLVTLVVLFPYPRLLYRHVAHWRDLQSLVQPEAPELAGWDAELRRWLLESWPQEPIAGRSFREWLSHTDPVRVQRSVEAFVLNKVKYAWDWDVWGMADYLPSVGEIFAVAGPREPLREDCDGRAVIAASLMRRLGYEARIVTDLRHVWVSTPQGEWMGPGRQKTLVSTSQGSRIQAQTLWTNLPVSLSYGIAVFPWLRELMILFTAYLLCCHRRMHPLAALGGGVLLLQGLLFMRCGVLAPTGVAADGSAWPAWVGIAHLLGGFVLLGMASRRARRRAGGDPRIKIPPALPAV